ncbi:MAG: GH36-type glycosyl hydrolase domain-containing protein [Myxococcaceae bacterium]
MKTPGSNAWYLARAMAIDFSLPIVRTLCVAAVLLALSGCTCTEPEPPGDGPYEPPAETCEASAPDEVRRFPSCSTGSGIFGRWTVDEAGLPAYDYGLDQNADARATFYNTEKKDRRDHWAAFGNGRVNALAFNDGYVEVVTQDRGVTYLNKFDEPRRNFAGGFGYLDDGEQTWCTAYKWRPAESRTTRRFGVGYADAQTWFRGVRASRRSFSPPGDAPVVLTEVTLENTSKQKKRLRHYEYWDVARRPIEINWMVSGNPFVTIPADAAATRDSRNGMFDEAVSWDSEARVLGLRRAHGAAADPPPREEPDAVDYYPGDPFLAVLVGEPSDVYADQTPFFGEGGVAAPAAVAARAAGEGLSSGPKGRAGKGAGQTRMFVVRSDLELSPGERKVLRFAYGYAPMGEPFAVDPSWRDPSADLRAAAVDSFRPNLMYFAAEGAPELHRELAWHAYQLETSVGRRDYWDQHVVPQGSAYLYLHGADGAARDLGLFALPLVYTHPSLAREELTLYMKITHAKDRRFSYAFQGHGMLDDALTLHGAPSDPPLYFLWALSEYLGATGDEALLDERVPFYPNGAEPNASGWDHVKGAVRHLFDTVGTGPHGLIRVQTGDWNDGIVVGAPDRALAIRDGESVPNTQMALAVLPRVADLVERRDPALAQEIRAKLPGYCDAVKRTWSGAQFGRAYFGDGKLFHATYLDLEAQVWPLLTDCFVAPTDRAALIELVHAKLDAPSPAGATLTPGGDVWPAISGVLTSGYARTRPDLAWGHLTRNTMAAHATAYPEVWYGIWSGPDGMNGPSGGKPGQTWSSPVTPMLDFPVMNNNQHAMPLFAALRVAGLEATFEGLRIQPRVPSRTFTLETALVDLSQRPGVLRGTYRKVGPGPRVLEVVAPDGEHFTSATLDAAPVTVPPGATSLRLTVSGSVSSFEAFSER